MTTPLSPAAQAVLDAAHRQPYMDADGRPNFAGAIAAALRVVADQVVPPLDPCRPALQGRVATVYQHGAEDRYLRIQRDFLAIATELDPNG